MDESTPQHQEARAVSSRGGRDGPAAPTVLLPVPPPGSRGLRVTGPGRKEREYVRRVRELETEVERRAGALAMLRREKAVSELVERGTGRWADRIERELDTTRAQASRLLVTLGALQRENEGLRRALGAARSASRLEPGPAGRIEPRGPRRPWWRRLTGGS